MRQQGSRGRYNGHTHCKYDAGVSARRSWSIPDTPQQEANHGCDAYRVLMAMFFFWGQPFRHLFHFKIR